MGTLSSSPGRGTQGPCTAKSISSICDHFLRKSRINERERAIIHQRSLLVPFDFIVLSFPFISTSFIPIFDGPFSSHYWLFIKSDAIHQSWELASRPPPPQPTDTKTQARFVGIITLATPQAAQVRLASIDRLLFFIRLLNNRRSFLDWFSNSSNYPSMSFTCSRIDSISEVNTCAWQIAWCISSRRSRVRASCSWRIIHQR